MNTDKLKDKARKFELKDQPSKAIEVYLKIIEGLEGTPEMDQELAIYNKVGDLYLKINDVNDAVDMYERAAKRYLESGFPNNAIALCNKILRNAPGRTHAYLMLAELMLQRGFVAEAKQHFIEYAERMSKAGQVGEAFRALKQFADASPQNDDVRAMLVEQLTNALQTDPNNASLRTMHAELTGGAVPETDGAAASAAAPTGVAPPSDLVFIDLADHASAAAPPAPAAPIPAAPPAPPPEPVTPTPAVPEPPVVEELTIQHGTPAPGGDDDLMVEGLDTSLGFDTGPIETLDLEPSPPASDEAELEVLEVEPAAPEPTPAPPPPTPEPEVFEVSEAAAEPTVDLPELEVPDIDLGGFDEAPAVPQPDETAVTSRPTEPVAVRPSEEVTELVLEDLEPPPAAPPEPEPVTLESLEAAVANNPEDAGARRDLAELLLEQGERERGFGELDQARALMEDQGDWTGAKTVAEEILRLEPNSVMHLQKRVEYTFRSGDRSKLVPAYLDLGTALFRSGALEQAAAVYERALELDPDNEDARQAIESITPVELETEPEPESPSPAAEPPALEPIASEPIESEPLPPPPSVEIPAAAPVADPAPPPAPTPEPVAATTEATPVGATPEAAAETARASQNFVDLGELILEEEEAPRKSTRMRGVDEQTGDEQRDFKDMLTQFKKGIEENIDEADADAHYDLGVAFKEMGLLDEAIGEFQKSLRSPAAHLSSAEALGTCFFEKGQFQVAATVMKRAVDADPAADDAKIGLLYWLGRCEEEQNRAPNALHYYQRVFAVDIHFQDVGNRVNTLAKAAR